MYSQANNSFKPTPHRGVNSVLYATLHAVATPPWGGLTPALDDKMNLSTADMKLTHHGKQGIAYSMYGKGKAFIGAYILLSDYRHSEQAEYVRLHLLCQGIEIVLKGVLLIKDYDTYKGKLVKPLGHNLTKCANLVISTYGANAMRPDLEKELILLDSFYKTHRLRYGGGSDFFFNPNFIQHEAVSRRIKALIRLTERSARRSAVVI